MSWVLIIIVLSLRSGIAIDHIDGYTSPEACQNAIQKIPTNDDVYASFCIPGPGPIRIVPVPTPHGG